MHLKETGRDDVDWGLLAWWWFVNTMNLLSSMKGGNYWATEWVSASQEGLCCMESVGRSVL